MRPERPITNDEFFLERMVGGSCAVLEPLTRKQQYLAALCGDTVTIPDRPIVADEFYLAALCGQSVAVPEPVTSIQMLMALALGMDAIDVPIITREEQYWAEYLDAIVDPDMYALITEASDTLITDAGENIMAR